LAELVRRHDDRALDLYLLFRAVASGGDWAVTESSQLWARALDLGTGPSARAAISKAWKRLEDLMLIERTRRGRWASVKPLLEDGSGTPYAGVSGEPNDRYFRLPFAYWTAPDGWHRRLSLPAKAMLLVALTRSGPFMLPSEKVKAWYGLSEDTAERGFRELRQADLLSVRLQRDAAPLAPAGYVEHRVYTLQPPFRPKPARSRKRRKTA
jgi:hypothetical protein